MINIDYIASKLSDVKIESSNLKQSIKQLMQHTEDSIQAHQELTELKLIDLVLISTNVKTWKLDELTVTIDIPWSEQTQARYLYGGCFPESVKRDVIVEQNCTGAQVFRRYTFKNDNATVHIRFYRDTFDGDKVDGCKVETIYTRPMNDRYYPRTSTPHLSISCPMKKGKYNYG